MILNKEESKICKTALFFLFGVIVSLILNSAFPIDTLFIQSAIFFLICMMVSIAGLIYLHYSRQRIC